MTKYGQFYNRKQYLLFSNWTRFSWYAILHCEASNKFVKSRFLMYKSKICVWQNFRISGVWHVEWWNLITSVRLKQVGNNEMTIPGTF